jgi:hypothetical protein
MKIVHSEQRSRCYPAARPGQSRHTDVVSEKSHARQASLVGERAHGCAGGKGCSMNVLHFDELSPKVNG